MNKKQENVVWAASLLGCLLCRSSGLRHPFHRQVAAAPPLPCFHLLHIALSWCVPASRFPQFRASVNHPHSTTPTPRLQALSKPAHPAP
eukprot:2925635-Rhodomonas_salina.3